MSARVVKIRAKAIVFYFVREMCVSGCSGNFCEINIGKFYEINIENFNEMIINYFWKFEYAFVTD